MKYTKESLAALLNGREMGDEITDREAKDAKESGLIVVFGSSDDLIEFRGAVYGEADCYGDGESLFDKDGIVLPWYDMCDDISDEEEIKKYFERKPFALKIKAIWGESPFEYAWTYETDIPHTTFDILEDGEKYCRGIVFNI